jgi:hypothetical protein
VALCRPCHNDCWTAFVLAESRRDSFEIVAVQLYGMQAKCSELIGQRLEISDVAGPSKPLKAVQVHDECEIQAMMAAEDQSLPIRPLIPFAIGGQAKEPSFPAFEFLAQGKACGKA